MSAATAVPVQHAGDFYVPQFEVWIGGMKQDGDLIHDVTQVTYRDHVEEVDRFELTVCNWDAASRRFKYSDRALFNPGQTLELRMGYRGKGQLQTMIHGEITTLRPSFPSSGQPTLAVSGLNILHSLRKEQKGDRYEDQTTLDIAARVCRRLGINFKQPTEALPVTPLQHLLQDNEYDVLFLLRLARRIGLDLVVTEEKDGPALSFGPSARTKVNYRLKYGASLIEFQPQFSTANQVAEVEVRGWDPVKGEEIKEVVGQSNLPAGAGLKDKMKTGTDAKVQDRREVITDQAVRDRQEARELALATLARINGETVTATGSVVGLPGLRAGSEVHLEGLGKRFNGRYSVNSTTHTIGMSGYVTQFECKLVELSQRHDGEALNDGR